MKVQVDRQGWKMIDGGASGACDGTAAVDLSTADAAAAPTGAMVPGSGVYPKVAEPTIATEPSAELGAMDTIPAPSSDAPSDIIPRPASVPPDLVALATAADAAERGR